MAKGPHDPRRTEHGRAGSRAIRWLLEFERPAGPPGPAIRASRHRLGPPWRSGPYSRRGIPSLSRAFSIAFAALTVAVLPSRAATPPGLIRWALPLAAALAAIAALAGGAFVFRTSGGGDDKGAGGLAQEDASSTGSAVEGAGTTGGLTGEGQERSATGSARKRCSHSSCASGSGGAIDPPVAVAFAPVRLMPIPARIASRCRQIQRRARLPLLCPTRLPRAIAAGIPTMPPPRLVVKPTGDFFGRRIAGVNIGYGAPWESSGWRAHRWRNRPCCFLHFEVFRRAHAQAAISPGARPARLGGKIGLLVEAREGSYYGGLYWANHVRFLWREQGIDYVANLHSFGEQDTERLLGQLVASLRPVDAIRTPPRRGTAVGSMPNALTTRDGSVWVASLGDGNSETRGTVYRVDTRTGRVIARGHPGPGVHGLALAGGSLWTATSTRITRLDPSTGRRQALIDVGRWPRGLAAAAGHLWVVTAAPFSKIRGALVRIDPLTGRVTGRVLLGRAPVGITGTTEAIWITDELDDELLRIDPESMRVVDRIAVGRMPTNVVSGDGAVWVANTGDGTVSRVDPQSDRTRTFRVGRAPRGLAIGAGSLWVACTGAGSVWRIGQGDRHAAVATRGLGDPLAITVTARRLWVTTNAEGRLLRLAVS